MWSIEEVKEDMKTRLSEARYNHCLRVMDVAKKLAEYYHYDVNKTMLTALAHDVLKELPQDQEEKWIQKDPTLATLPAKVRHGYMGAKFVEQQYGFDEEMAAAIACHTTGKKNMSLLDKIVFLADKIEPGKHYPGIEEERELAFLDLDQAIILCLQNQIRKLTQENRSVSPASQETLAYLQGIH